MQRLYVDGGSGRHHALRAENPGSAALQLGLPGRDLIGVDVEVLGQLSYRSVTLDGLLLARSNSIAEGPIAVSDLLVLSLTFTFARFV